MLSRLCKPGVHLLGKKGFQLWPGLRHLSQSLRVAIFLAIVFPVLVLIIIYYFRTKQDLTEYTYTRRQTIAQFAAMALYEKLEHLKDIGTSLATRVLFRELISKGQWSEAIKLMSDIPKSFPMVDRIFVADLGGNLRADTPALPNARGQNFKNSDWYRGVTQEWKPYISEVYKRVDESHYNIVAIAVPIKNGKNNIVGILVLQVVIKRPLTWVKGVEIGPSGFIYIVDKNGNIVFHPKYSEQENIPNYLSVPVVKKVLRGKSGVEINYNPIDKEEQIAAYTPVPAYGWGVIAQEPTKTAFALQVSNLRTLLIISSAIFILTCGLAFAILWFISKIKQAEEKITKSQIFVDSVIENIPDVVFVKDAKDLTFVRLNKAGEELLGLSQNEVLGKSIYDLFPKSEADFFTLSDRKALSSGKILDIPEETVRTKHKDKRIIHTRKVPLYDNAGNPSYLISISEDITDKVGLAEARMAQKVAEELAERKTRFLDIAAHELRTPITSISLFLQVAEKQIERGQPLAVDILHRLRAPIDRLTKLVIDLLDMSRLERGLVILTPIQTDMVALISECVEEFRAQAPGRSFIFEKPDQTIEISVDPLRINQVITNLLDNAVKYTTGDIEISIIDSENLIRVSVTDHGAGIPKEQQTILFTAFSRGSSDATIRASGLGLGLSICHGIMGLHGGTIGLVSEKGQGSTFYFELPKKDIKR